MQTLQIRNSTAEFLIFTKKNKIAELFGTTRNNITMHLRDILSKELDENSVCKNFLHTAEDGKNINCN